MKPRRELTPEERQEAQRLNAAWLHYKAENKGATQTWLAAEAGLGTQGAVGQYLRGVIPLNVEALVAICRVIGANPIEISPRMKPILTAVMRVGKIATEPIASPDMENESQQIDRRHQSRRAGDFDVLSADETDKESGKIEYWDARGSCGGGFLNYAQLPKGHLIKEQTFFSRFNLRPENAIAVYADGDSMADFIVDGDIVIFDRSKTSPVSGEIFLIDHPDGLRIKTLRRGLDGSWTLESRNPDKRRFPDERVPPDQADLLKIHGQFVYRQGGY